ncbi:MAG: radical SAM protein [Acidobacteria bacterium]|nr:radical SAM protein [Acidobacteriota bacterium]
MEKKINWGISADLQADVRFEPNACKLYVMDISLGCPFQCNYCLFSPLELMVYKLKNPGYQGDILPLKLDKFLAREEFPPVVYLSYASDPLGNRELIANTITVLKKLFSHNVHILLITKGIYNDELLQVIGMRPDLMEVQVGVTNCTEERNKIIEPGAPSYEVRRENLEKLAAVKDLRSLVLILDPLFPGIDDTEENIGKVIGDAAALGIKRAVMSYLVLPPGMKDKLRNNEFTRSAAEAISEKTPTISQQELYSFPFEMKIEKFTRFDEICRNKGIKMSVCGCKEHRFKETNFGWTCFPFFTKEKREELSKNSSFKLDTSHLKCHDLNAGVPDE